MMVSRLPLALLMTASLSGCYPIYLESARLRESYSEYREKHQENRPFKSDAEKYAPNPAKPVPSVAGMGDDVVGRLLRIKFEDAAPVQTFGLPDVSQSNGVLDNPLTGLLHRGGGGMSATVVRQLYDGRLLIHGEKALSGDDTGFLLLEGIVDPSNIDNGTVPSNRIAEVRLQYRSDHPGPRPAEFVELEHFFQASDQTHNR